jgi:hypothetical protein
MGRYQRSLAMPPLPVLIRGEYGHFSDSGDFSDFDESSG